MKNSLPEKRENYIATQLKKTAQEVADMRTAQVRGGYTGAVVLVIGAVTHTLTFVDGILTTYTAV